ncbi:Major facilitator superfamily permease [Rhodospirillaceae bacterium LM-1]|nr:Major facilitator superfamily permease [Rhodospirillaceae bacterium LM-1]
MSVPPPFLKLRLAAHYAGLFAPVGVMLPFWPVFLSGRGLSEWQIGVLLAVGSISKVAVNPVIGSWVDRLGKRRTAMIGLAFATFFAFAAFWVTHGFFPLLILSAIASGLFTAQMPLAENLSLHMAQTHQFDYGRVRLWGSLAFILAALLGGWYLSGRSSEVVLPVSLAFLLLMALITLGLPEMQIEKRKDAPQSAVGMMTLLQDRRFLLFIATASALQTSHMVYYGFSTLHWRQAGIGETTIGVLWSLGVLAEILLFSQGNKVLNRLGPAGLMILAGAGGLVRWTVLGFTTWIPALYGAQALHALTFGAFHLGCMHYLSRNIPLSLSGRAQGLYSSGVAGVAQGIGLLAAGPLYHALGGYAFLAMTAVSGLGLWGALRIQSKGKE